MAKQEKLWCQVGQHHWSRSFKPGRKPVACPDHRGSDPKAMNEPKVKIQHAVGISDGKVKGDDGTVIGVPNVIKGDEGMVEWIATPEVTGWTWTLFEAAPRPTQPPPAPEPAERPTEPERRISEVEPPKTEAPKTTVVKSDDDDAEDGPVVKVQVRRLVDLEQEYSIDEETRRKLAYIERQLTGGRRKKDASGLQTTRDMIINRLKRKQDFGQ